MKPMLIYCLLAITLLACSSATITEQEKITEDGTTLQFVSRSGFQEFYIAKNTSLDRYQSVQYEPLSMGRLNINQKRIDPQARNWQLTEENKHYMAMLFAERVKAFYETSHELALANTAGDNTLKVQFELLEFLPNASQDSGVERAARSDIFTRGIGKLHVRATLSDASSGQIIATLEENREVGDTRLEKNNRSKNIRKLRSHFDSWISRLDATLGKL